MNIAELESKTREELLANTRELGITGVSGMKKEELIVRLLQMDAELQGYAFRGGVLEIMDEGYGFLRKDTLRLNPSDIYVSQSQIRRFALRTGDMVNGQVRPPKDSEKYHSLLRVETVNSV
ncbi:Rho termination factor N-terminal domain-containing protein, partial [Chloroflexota bacterium]